MTIVELLHDWARSYRLDCALRHLSDHIFERFLFTLDWLIFAILHSCNGTNWYVDLIEAMLAILNDIFRCVDILIGVIRRFIFLLQDWLA